MTPLKDTTQYAWKFYKCDACAAWNRSGYGKADVSADDWLIIEGAQAERSSPDITGRLRAAFLRQFPTL